MADSARIETRSYGAEARCKPFRTEEHGATRRDTLPARDGRPLLRQILGPDGVVRTRLARAVVLDAIRASSGR